MFVERENIFGFGICGHLSRYHTCATQLPPNFAKAKRKSCFPLRMKLFHVEFPEWTQRTSFGLLTQNCAVICKFTLFRGGVNNSPLLRCWRPISPNGAAIIREILPTNNIHISFPKYYCSPLNLFTIFQIQPLSTERAFFVDPFTKFLNIHFLILEDVVAFETQEVGGCIDLQNTRRFPPLSPSFVVVLRTNTCCWARARLPLPGLTLPQDSASVRKLLWGGGARPVQCTTTVVSSCP